LNAIHIEITDNLTEFLMKDTAEKTSLLFFLMIMMSMLLHCHYCVVYKVLWERSTIQSHRVAMTSIYQGVEGETSASYAWERVLYILQLNKEITDLTDLKTKKSWFHLHFVCYSLLNKAESLPIWMQQTWSIAQDHQPSWDRQQAKYVRS